MAEHEWFEITDGCVERTESLTIVRDEEGNTMFTLPWHADLRDVTVIKQLADKAYRIGRSVGCNQKVSEIRRALELPLGPLERERG